MPAARQARAAVALGAALTAAFSVSASIPAVAASPSVSVVCASAEVDVPRNQTVAFDLECSTTDSGAVDGFTLVSRPTKAATFTFDQTTGHVTYAALPQANGTDSFRFKAFVSGLGESQVTTAVLDLQNTRPVCEPVSSISVAHDRTARVDLACSDADGDQVQLQAGTRGATHGTVSVTGTTLSYKPAPRYTGADSFSVVATDGATLSDEIPVTVSVTNARPTCVSRSLRVRHDRAASIRFRCTDADGDRLTPAIVARPQHGTVSLADGRLLYKPARRYLGSDTFTFATSDGLRTSPRARVSLTVTNALPECERGSSFATRGRHSFRFTCKDSDGDDVQVAVADRPRHGVLKVRGNRVTYIPHRRYTGRDSFALAGKDGVSTSRARRFDVRVRRHR